MKKSKKIAITIALCLMAAGVLIFTLTFALANFSFEGLDSSIYTTKEYTISEPIKTININCDTTNITILPSEGNTCRLICHEDEKLPHTVTAENNTLIIKSTEKHGYDFTRLFSFRTAQIVLYLPYNVYDSLTVHTSTGKINLENTIAEKIELHTSTGHINLKNTDYAKYVDVEVTTGKISIENINCNNLQAKVTTGDISLNTVLAMEIGTTSTTGDIKFTNTIAEGNISANSTTGNVTFEWSDGKNIFVNTTTGNISGTILTTKKFNTSTSTGKINVPDSISTDVFEAITSTGDIKINYATN